MENKSWLDKMIIDKTMRDVDIFYSDKKEPIKGTLLALKNIILDYNSEIIPIWKYKLPCFMYQNQMFCCLWVDKKTQLSYICIEKHFDVEHPELIKGSLSFPKLLLINPEKDIPIKVIYTIFDMSMKLYK